MTARLARQVKWYTGLQPLPLATVINRGSLNQIKDIDIETSRGISYAQTLKLQATKVWVFKLPKSFIYQDLSLQIFSSSSKFSYQDLKESVIDPRTSCETLGLAFEEKNRRKLSISSRKFQRLYPHIFKFIYYIFVVYFFFLVVLQT